MKPILILAITAIVLLLWRWFRPEPCCLPNDDGPVVLWVDDEYAIIATGPGWREG